ncbi:MAG TPA: penicillin-binding transpeptidase domain-containing protein [Pseudobdellovibrionaceae bacterium]|nr:penicillin-binding transpeptidase domain-containing protein [Pseudobdellovibrionaceae bacterium]
MSLGRYNRNMYFKDFPKLTGTLVLAVFFFGLLAFNQEVEHPANPQDQIKDERRKISQLIAQPLREKKFEAAIKDLSSQQMLKFNYTLNSEMQNEAEKLLKSYKPDYGAIVVMDAKTGRILAMSSFERGGEPHRFRKALDPEPTPLGNLNLRATYPAASIYKIITATAAIERAGITPDHKIYYNGGAYTLYRRNVLSDRVTRYTNVISLRDAFARSINTAFGRVTLELLTPKDLQDFTQKFMFNQPLHTDFPVENSSAIIPAEKGFELTEVASGYNNRNVMSPVHGAMIAGAVANDGVLMAPYLVEQVKDSTGNTLYQGKTLELQQVASKENIYKLRELMERTVLAGTSRKSFRSLTRNRKFREIEMGGKTGHLTGTNPRGRVDWFVGYAIDGDEKISVAALTVNRQFWTVKSSYLGQSMFRKYFIGSGGALREKPDQQVAGLQHRPDSRD